VCRLFGGGKFQLKSTRLSDESLGDYAVLHDARRVTTISRRSTEP
jgi:hypothetical protein